MARPHDVLGVAVDAPFDTVVARYRTLAQQHHPDKGGDVARFRAVTAAYEALRAKHVKRGPFDDIFDVIAKEHREC